MKAVTRCLQAGLVIILMLLVALAPVGAAPREARAQPVLFALAQQDPNARVGVIVQKLQGKQGVEALVARLGGVVTQDLHIINAFAAELTATAAVELSRAPGVRWVSFDAPVVETGNRTPACTTCIDTVNLKSTYVYAVGADTLWNTAPYLQGQGITVAVIDSGINAGLGTDFGNRVLAGVKFNASTSQGNDFYGHGTHVAGIIGGDGAKSSGTYIGIAPKVNLINLKVSDDTGAGTAADVVAAMQWVLDNKATYNIRVVNISLNSSVDESYHTNPMSAAAEILWFNGIVVVVSAGNEGKNSLYPPANDPFVITVGATDDLGTRDFSDDKLASYSGSGLTIDGFTKPDLVAPGHSIVSTLANEKAVLPSEHPDHIVKYSKTTLYFRMSGTSMAAPVVSGAAALLLQDEPGLNPDQVKFRLMATALNAYSTPRWSNYQDKKTGAGLLSIPAAVNGTTTAAANTGVPISQLLTTGDEAVTWNSVNWNSVNWNSVNWNSVNWNSVNWNSVNWNSVNWNQ